MAHQVIESVLEDLRPSFDQDGFGLSVGSISADGAVEIIFSATPDACVECLVPDDVLLQILDSAIRDKAADVTGVTLTKVGFERLESHG
jgi:Fe-S cluster biogenesis protein NfuA